MISINKVEPLSLSLSLYSFFWSGDYFSHRSLLEQWTWTALLFFVFFFNIKSLLYFSFTIDFMRFVYLESFRWDVDALRSFNSLKIRALQISIKQYSFQNGLLWRHRLLFLFFSFPFLLLLFYYSKGEKGLRGLFHFIYSVLRSVFKFNHQKHQ